MGHAVDWGRWSGRPFYSWPTFALRVLMHLHAVAPMLAFRVGLELIFRERFCEDES